MLYQSNMFSGTRKPLSLVFRLHVEFQIALLAAVPYDNSWLDARQEVDRGGAGALEGEPRPAHVLNLGCRVWSFLKIAPPTRLFSVSSMMALSQSPYSSLWTCSGVSLTHHRRLCNLLHFENSILGQVHLITSP